MTKTMGEKEGQVMVTIYREIQEAAARYAMANNYELVLTHIDAISEADYLHPGNVASKMQQRALVPIYYTPSMDISKEVVQALNSSYRPATPGAAPVTPASATAPPGR